jgi:pimeloyl-ACP methyl ester carboxylesterase
MVTSVFRNYWAHPSEAEEMTLEKGAGHPRVLHAGPDTGKHSSLPLVLIPGGGSDNSGITWYRLIKPLSRDRKVWAVDLPGLGGSINAGPVGGPVC